MPTELQRQLAYYDGQDEFNQHVASLIRVPYFAAAEPQYRASTWNMSDHVFETFIVRFRQTRDDQARGTYPPQVRNRNIIAEGRRRIRERPISDFATSH